MTLTIKHMASELFFFAGLFALLFIAMSSSSEELGMSVQIHTIPLPTLEAQTIDASLGLP